MFLGTRYLVQRDACKNLRVVRDLCSMRRLETVNLAESTELQ